MPLFVQYGAGNIGRGFIATLFAAAGYEIAFIDVSPLLIDELNSRGEYTVTLCTNSGSTEERVQNVSCVNGTNDGAVDDIISRADVMATAIGVNILPRIAPVLARGLSARFSRNDRPLNIIICENMVDADKFLRAKVAENMDEQNRALLTSRVGFVEASVGRMVPVPTAAMREKDPLAVLTEPYRQLPIDRDAIVGEFGDIPCVHPLSPFEFYIRRKLYIHNMGHCICAYLGALSGCEYIWQAMENPAIKLIALRAMTASAEALSEKYSLPLAPILLHIEDLLGRFSNRALGDTCARVGADAKRKLSAVDRLVGGVNISQNSGAHFFAALGIAAGLRFAQNAPESDAGSREIGALIAEKGAETVLRDHCGLSDEVSDFVLEACNALAEGGISAALALAERRRGEYLSARGII